TGESLPVTKDVEWVGDEDVPIGDRVNMAFAGSIVSRGRATGIVVATGNQTLVGQLARDLSAAGGKPPLLVRMERFTNVIAVATLAIAVAIGALGATLGQFELADMLI